MSDYGLRVLLDNGRYYDSNLDAASDVGSVSVPASTDSGSVAYPGLAGLTGFAIATTTSASAFGVVNLTFDHSQGYPVLNFVRTSAPGNIRRNDALILVFAR